MIPIGVLGAVPRATIPTEPPTYFDIAQTHSSITLSNSARTATGNANNGGHARAVSPRASGKWYIEVVMNAYNLGVGSNGIGILGLATSSSSLANYLGGDAGCCGLWFAGNIIRTYLAGVEQSPTGISGPRFRMAWDADTGQVWYGGTSWSGDPAAGTGPAHTSSALIGTHHVASGPRNIGNQVTLSASPAFAVPSGYTYWSQ